MAKLKRKKKYTGRHSPAGLRYLEEQKRKKVSQAGLSRQAKGQLQGLSDADYKAVMKMLKRKPSKRKR